ncbi:MAG: secondary thiamine-phosphate synthase enzyme YjbQ [Planctomycetia bacterium]|nr:secondary thiamine-phosphate synthase enzyme YjbQ [Planctomycetia bacterium]
MQSFKVKTHKRVEFIDITDEVSRAVSAEGTLDGTCTVYVPHTTAGITINENADPSVVADIIMQLDRIVPLDGGYRHSEGNSAAHIKSSLLGHSVKVLVKSGEPVLGTWQGIFFCEFDGPRTRTVHVA